MMDELLGLWSGIAQRVVIKLGSVLSDGSHGAAIYVLHPTFLEYLQSTLRDPPIVTISEAEALMAKGCSKVLFSGLKYNIRGISQPSTYHKHKRLNRSKDKEIDLKRQFRKSITPALRYAAFHGLPHVAASLHTVESVQGVCKFFESRLLNWVELMGWYQQIHVVLRSVHDLKTCIEATLSSTELSVSINSTMSPTAQIITVNE